MSFQLSLEMIFYNMKYYAYHVDRHPNITYGDICKKIRQDGSGSVGLIIRKSAAWNKFSIVNIFIKTCDIRISNTTTDIESIIGHNSLGKEKHAYSSWEYYPIVSADKLNSVNSVDIIHFIDVVFLTEALLYNAHEELKTQLLMMADVFL